MNRRLIVYVAGPVRKGDLCYNIQQADRAFYTLMKTGLFAPIVPHWTCYAGDCQPAVGMLGSVWARANGNGHYPDLTGDDFVRMDLSLVKISDAVLRLPGYSVGADAEVECAKESRIPVFTDIARLIDWGRAINEDAKNDRNDR